MVVGVKELTAPNDRLRYSPFPPERVLFLSKNRCNDLRRKCLSKLVVKGTRCDDRAWNIKVPSGTFI